MKRLKDILGFLITLVKPWKIVLPIFMLVISALITVLKFGKKNVTINLPVWAWTVLIFAALALYLLGKLVEFINRRKKASDSKLYGLLWRVPFLFFRFLIPLCPQEGCGCQVICKEIAQKPYQVYTNPMEINNFRLESEYVYECPILGKINGVPNEEISLLHHKTKLALKKRKRRLSRRHPSDFTPLRPVTRLSPNVRQFGECNKVRNP